VENRTQPSGVEAEAILTVCMLAAFADGANSDVERAAIKRMAETLPNIDSDHSALYQKVLLGQISSAQAVQPIARQALRQLAYEMAVCVCEADNFLTPREKGFLHQLNQVLGLGTADAERIEKDAEAIAFPNFADAPSSAPAVAQSRPMPAPAAAAVKAEDIDSMILNYSILNGALELMPQSLSTLAIIPLQMKMVYRIGKKYGYDLDRGHIKELLAAAGVGLSSQVLEGYASKLFGGLFGKIGGKLGKTVANQATSSAISFAATYAIGHLAQNYYAGGRTLSNLEMRQLFDQLKDKATNLYSRYAGEIQQRSRSIDTTQLVGLIRGQ
jgi:uncharacterized protein (DUF697 family)/tellurite resistance protein